MYQVILIFTSVDSTCLKTLGTYHRYFSSAKETKIAAAEIRTAQNIMKELETDFIFI